jgi:hypothetical protein
MSDGKKGGTEGLDLRPSLLERLQMRLPTAEGRRARRAAREFQTDMSLLAGESAYYRRCKKDGIDPL